MIYLYVPTDSGWKIIIGRYFKLSRYFQILGDSETHVDREECFVRDHIIILVGLGIYMYVH